MTQRQRIRRGLLVLLGAGAVVAIVVGMWVRPFRNGSPSAGALPVPPYSANRFLNTGTDAQYIGVAACAGCHRQKHESYLHSEHSRALADLDPAAEPPDGQFFHQASGRFYRIHRRDNQLWHEEILRTEQGQEMARLDVPVRYVIGSGHFTRSYLVEIDGFLHESPITWYASRKAWDMSPGYDVPNHWGFERSVDSQCLFCHTGRAAPVAGSVHRWTLPEKGIGCENCHGPGSVHQDFHQTRHLAPGTDDLTIVNPGKLPRPLLEAICSVCHLQSAATTTVRGRRQEDFRPGRPLSDYRIYYRLDAGDEQMTVVGHVDQLQQSVCYQQAKEMSCLTCHDPHARQKPKDAIAYYRQRCLHCHTLQACGLKEPERLKKNAADNCIACHMPRGDTDIPHIAFTHHRIGKHEVRPPADRERIPNLVPLGDIAHLGPVDHQRNLGLAYLLAAQSPRKPPYAEVFCNRAQDLLEAAQTAGLRDPETSLALTSIYLNKDRLRSKASARQVIDAKDASSLFRSLALNALAGEELRDRNFVSAQHLLEEVVQLRRSSEDWRLLGISHLEQDHPHEAVAAFERALAIRPYRPAIHAGLAESYRRLGETAHAKEHTDKAQWLFRHNQN